MTVSILFALIYASGFLSLVLVIARSNRNILTEIRTMNQPVLDLLAKMNDATNAVAAQLASVRQQLADAIAAGQVPDPALLAALQVHVDTLNALAADPANPVPALPAPVDPAPAAA